MLNKKQIITTLKIISILIFISISVHGEHVSVPFGFVIIVTIYAFFENLKAINIETFSVLLTLIGIILIPLSIKQKNKNLVIIGYLLTYILLFGSLFMSDVLQKPEKNSYFFITSGVYFIISIYIIWEALSFKKN